MADVRMTTRMTLAPAGTFTLPSEIRGARGSAGVVAAISPKQGNSPTTSSTQANLHIFIMREFYQTIAARSIAPKGDGQTARSKPQELAGRNDGVEVSVLGDLRIDFA